MKKIIALVCAAVLCVSLLCACSTAVENTNGTAPTENVKAEKDLGFTVEATPAEKLEDSLVDYESANGTFTAKIPEGWNVSYGGTDMLYWIRAYDPENPCLQVFTLLKADVMLKSAEAKAFFESMRGFALYQMSADAVVVDSVEAFYKNIMDYSAFLTQYEPTFAGFEFPQISDFETIEAFEYNSSVHSVAMDDKIIHGSFTEAQSGEKGEGMFTGSLCDSISYYANGINTGYNCLYNVNGITAPYGMLSEYEGVLNEIFSSISYTDLFVRTVLQNSAAKVQNAAQLNQTLSATSDIITSGWNERQKTYDTLSEQYSDATLGYDRVYDTETGEVYRAELGFLDDYSGDRLQPITDDMYSEPIVGYIVK